MTIVLHVDLEAQIKERNKMIMLHKKIDDKMRIVLGSDCMRILQCKPGDEVDIKMLCEDESCHVLMLTKVKKDIFDKDYSSNDSK